MSQVSTMAIMMMNDLLNNIYTKIFALWEHCNVIILHRAPWNTILAVEAIAALLFPL